MHSQSNPMQGDTIQYLCHVDRIRMFKTHVVDDRFIYKENFRSGELGIAIDLDGRFYFIGPREQIK